MITTVILDFDGTLVSSLKGIHACFQEALAISGYGRPSLAEVRMTVGLTLEESVSILTNGQCDDAQLKEPHPRRVLIVGDTEADILFAKNAGLRSCWASYGYGDEAVCKALAPEFILPDIARLPGLIQSINSPEQAESRGWG